MQKPTNALTEAFNATLLFFALAGAFTSANAASRYEFRVHKPGFAVQLAGEPGTSDNGTPSSPPPNGQPLTYTAELSTTLIDFQDVGVGNSLTKQFTLSNTGTGSISLQPLDVSGADLSVSTTCGTTLSPGQSCLTDVTFSPAQPGAVQGRVNISAPTQGVSLNVTLQGSGVQAQARLLPDSSNSFADTVLGHPATRSFTFTNIGNAPASGVYAFLSPYSGLALSANTCGTQAAPVSVGAGQSCTMSVTFTPTATASFSGVTLSVASPSFTAPAQVQLSGSAVERDPYWNNVIMLMHFDGVDQSKNFIEQKGKTVTVHGQNTVISSTSAKFGTGGLYLPGSGGTSSGSSTTNSYLTFPGTGLDFGVGDFTVEYWWKQGSSIYYDEMFSTGTGSNDFSMETDKNYGLVLRTYNTYLATRYDSLTNNIPLNTWQHIAVTRASGVLRIFINGQMRHQVTNNTNLTASATAAIGAFPTGTYDANGSMDEFRVTKGIARYESNFTPQTAPFPDQ